MIVSKYGKSYDTSDGSEQPSGGSTRRQLTEGPSAQARLHHKGAGASPGDTAPVGEYASKPGWSVRSLMDLNAAIRRGRSADDPRRLRQASERARRASARAAEARADAAADGAHARRNQYRNDWEHT